MTGVTRPGTKGPVDAILGRDGQARRGCGGWPRGHRCLGLALGDRDETAPSFSSTQALAGDIDAHGIGCSRVYPNDLRIWADHDAAVCEVGSATVTLHVWKGFARPTDLGEASRHTPWVVGTNWLVATTNRLAATQVAMVIGGDLVPS